MNRFLAIAGGEALILARRVCAGDEARVLRAQARLEEMGGRTRSVAQVYRACA
jgi:hypothetical protein